VAQQFLKQMVIAKPLILTIQRNQKKIGLPQLVQNPLAGELSLLSPDLLQHDIAKGGTEAIQNRGVHQKPLDRFRLLGQNFIHQVFCDVAMGAANGLN
jgi:hypothetical protein